MENDGFRVVFQGGSWWFMAVFNHPAGFQPNLNHGAFCSNGDFLCGDLLVLHRQKVSWRVADFPYLVLQGLFFSEPSSSSTSHKVVPPSYKMVYQ